MRGLAVCLAALLLAGAAEARVHAPYKAHRMMPRPAALDGLATQPAAAYSLRKVKSAYAGPALKLRRMSDSAMLDIGFLGFTSFTGAPLDVAAANAHCPTRCEIETWYDQSGNGRDAARAGADSADYVADCGNGLPCLRTDAATDLYLISASVTWAAGKTSLSAVGKRGAGTGGCVLVSKGNLKNILQTNTVASQWLVTDSTTTSFPLAAADNAWHAGIGVIDGAASVGRIDATETAGANVTGSGAAGSMVLAYGAAATTCDMTEAIAWDNYALTLAERAALTANQRGFWP